MDTKHRFYAWLALVSTLLLCVLLTGFLSLPELHTNGYTILGQVALQQIRIERMTKDALLIVGPSPFTSFTQAASELQVTLPLWEATEKGLQVGSVSLGLPAHTPPDILLLIIQAQPDYVAIDTALHNIIAKPNSQGQDAQLQALIVLNHEATYYQFLTRTYNAWQERIDSAEDQLYSIEVGMLGALVFLVVGNFIGMMRYLKKKRLEAL